MLTLGSDKECYLSDLKNLSRLSNKECFTFVIEENNCNYIWCNNSAWLPFTVPEFSGDVRWCAGDRDML